MALRDDREPGAVNRERKLNNFINLFLWSSPAAAGGLNHVRLEWLKGKKPIPENSGGGGGASTSNSERRKKLVRPHYTCLNENRRLQNHIPGADAGRMSSFPLSIHELSAPKFREGRGIISSDSELECLQAVKRWMNSGDLMEEECACVCLKEAQCSAFTCNMSSLRLHKLFF